MSEQHNMHRSDKQLNQLIFEEVFKETVHVRKMTLPKEYHVSLISTIHFTMSAIASSPLPSGSL